MQESAARSYTHRMHRWLDGVGRLRDAVTHGQPSSVVEQAMRFTTELDHLHNAPATWQPSLTRLRQQAEPLTAGVSLAKAGAAVAEMADACGTCHEDSGIAAAVESAIPESELPGGDTPAAKMRHHGWAAQRMWEGLTAPSERRWVRGTTMFVMEPLCGEGDPKTIDPRCARARALARRSHTVTDRRGRVALYGEMLANCGECHAEHVAPLAHIADP